MSGTTSTILAILIVVVIGTVAYVLFSTGDRAVENGTDDRDTEDQNGRVPVSWQTYSDQQFDLTFAYPEEATANIEAGRVKITYIGPASEMGTEITDGFTFYVRTENVAQNADLQTVAEEQFQRETERLQGISQPQQVSIGNRAAYRFEVESELGMPVTYVVMQADAGTVFLISYSISDPQNRGYEAMVRSMMRSLEYTGEGLAGAPTFTTVLIALLDTEYEGEPDRGCDQVVMVERDVATTTMPLTVALEELFSIEENRVDELYNFIASTNDTLSFERAVVENNTAHIYLTGSLSGLAGVCDNPRAQIQIEETALQFPTVDEVQIYLNGTQNELTPSER